MYAAAALLVSSAPVAGLYLSAESRSDQQDLFICCYASAIGLIGSLIAIFGLDDGIATALAFTPRGPT